jgi:ABC-2 type transport system ATP-binding protein
MRRRLEIARTLIHEPKVLFLDEPTSGLDPQSRRVVWDLLRNIRQESSITVFLTTHYMEEAEALCSRIAIIDVGKIVVLGSPQELKQRIPGNDIVSLTLDELSDAIVDTIKSQSFVHRVHTEDNDIRVYVDIGARDLPLILESVRSTGGKTLLATVREQSLEDVFIHYTGRSIRDEGPRKVSKLSPGMPRRLGR